MVVRKKFIFIDLYNLHLKIGPPPAEGRGTSLLDRKEKKKLMQFFKHHAPRLVRYTTADEVRRKFTTPTGQTKVDVDETAWTLGGYELLSGTPWFEGEDFSFFAHQYQELRKFVDEYVKGELSIESLSWLEREASEREVCVFVKTPEAKVYTLRQLELSEGLKTIPLSKFQITLDWRTVVSGKRSHKTRFPNFVGAELKLLFYYIYDELADLLEGKHKIGRCKYSNCHDIFWKSRPNKIYCTPGHQSVASSIRYQRKEYLKHRAS